MDTSDRKWFIYILIDPRDDEVRYVGWTFNINKRYKSHISNRKQLKHTYKIMWIEQLVSLNMLPKYEIIESGYGVELAAVAEKKWIAYYKNIGTNLTNLTEGGDGASGWKHTEQSKEKLLIAAGRRRKDISECHGTLTGYKKGCRNICCVTVHSDWVKERKIIRNSRETVKHGVYTSRRDGCLCDLCISAGKDYNRKHRNVKGYRKLKKEDIASIRNDYTGKYGEFEKMAKLYGVSPSTISRTVRGLINK